MSPSGDLGQPISYLTLEEGTPVFGADGEEVGHVAHVLADDEEDVFDGIVIAHGLGHHVFADADQVDAIHERGVTLTLSAAEAEELPRPSENPAVMEADPSDTVPAKLGGKLRRAWQLLSGDY
jgi:PRC-barrel domain